LNNLDDELNELELSAITKILQINYFRITLFLYKEYLKLFIYNLNVLEAFCDEISIVESIEIRLLI